MHILLAAIINQAGGSLRIEEKALLAVSPHVVIMRRSEPDTMDTLFYVKEQLFLRLQFCKRRVKMTQEQKLAAINSLQEMRLRMRGYGDWCVSMDGVEVKKGAFLHGVQGRGATPEEAVNNLWCMLVDSLVVMNAYSSKRREYRWNGFVWKQLHAD